MRSAPLALLRHFSQSDVLTSISIDSCLVKFGPEAFLVFGGMISLTMCGSVDSVDRQGGFLVSWSPVGVRTFGYE